MYEELRSWVRNNRWDHSSDWDDYVDSLARHMKDTFGDASRGIDIETTYVDDDCCTTEIVEDVVVFCRYRKILYHTTYYDEQYDTTFVVYKYIPRLEE